MFQRLSPQKHGEGGEEREVEQGEEDEADKPCLGEHGQEDVVGVERDEPGVEVARERGEVAVEAGRGRLAGGGALDAQEDGLLVVAGQNGYIKRFTFVEI